MRKYLSAFACALMVFGCATDSLLWQRYTENDFPAQVHSVNTPQGNVDAKNRLTYGSWTVSFGEGTPYASYNCSLYTICEITISNLRCDHSAGGRAPCELKLKDNATCKLAIPERREAFQIRCPFDVALEPKSKGDKDQITVVPLQQQGAASPEEGTVVAAKEAEGRYIPRGLVLGLRAGVAIPTQKVLENLDNSTTVGPLVNFEALYALREWVRVGIMFEWHRHDINLEGPQFGTLNVFSLLPTVEFRPTRAAMRDRGFEWFIPYASLGTGVNFHSFSNAFRLGNADVSFDNTFALRLASGVDFPITPHWAFNTEVAWNRDSGSFKINGAEADFNASSLNLLIGLRVQF
jgi:outer membrane protein